MLVLLVVLAGVAGAALPAVAAAASVSIRVNQWERNLMTGVVTYDVTLTWADLSTGNGPCAGTRCRMVVDERYREATTDVSVRTMVNSEMPGGSSLRLNGSAASVNTTHLLVRIFADDGVQRDSAVAEVAVAPPPPPAQVTLTVHRWEAFAGYNSTWADYDVTVTGESLGRYGGPCSQSCEWYIHAYHRDASGDQYLGSITMQQSVPGFSFNSRRTGEAYLPGASDNRPANMLMAGVRHIYGSPPPSVVHRVPVTRLTVADLDLAPALLLVAPLTQVARDQICLPLLTVPDPGSTSSVPRPFLACDAIVAAGTGALTANEIRQIWSAVGRRGADISRELAPPTGSTAPPDPGTGGALLHTDALTQGHARTINPGGDGVVTLPTPGEEQLAQHLITRRRSDTMTLETARVVARRCRQLTAAPGANLGLTDNGSHPCKAVPIYAPGQDVARAAQHRDAAIRGNPTTNAYGDPPVTGYAPWIQLNYVPRATRIAQGLVIGWYDRVEYTQCKPVETGVSCDEFPNFSTAQSGPPASRPTPGPTASLRKMPTTPTNPNSLEGTRYSQFLAFSSTGCGLTEGTMFLEVPLANDRDHTQVFPDTAWACTTTPPSAP